LEDAAKLVMKQLAELGHSIGFNGRKQASQTKPTMAAKTAKAGRKHRMRRGPDQLKAEATKALAMIRKAGKEGIAGVEIRKSVPGVGQNIKDFVQKNGGVKLKTTGQRSAMRYFAA
jgi:hypothetical protein